MIRAKDRPIKFEVVKIEVKNHKFVTVRFTWKEWSWKKFKSVEKTADEIFFERDRKFNTLAGTGAGMYYCMTFKINPRNAEIFNDWLFTAVYAQEHNLIIPAEFELMDGTLIGKIFEAIEEFKTRDIVGKEHTFKKSDCVTVVDIVSFSNGNSKLPVFCLLAGEKKIYLPVIPSKFKQL